MIFIAGLIAALILPAHLTLATDYSSTNFTVKDSVIVPGSGYSTSSSYQLWSSVGQPAIGISQSITFTGKAGFLYFPAAATSSPAPSPAPTPTPTPGGGGPGPVATSSVPTIPTRPSGGLICDFDNDGKCNIIDFSILLYHFGEPVSAANSEYDLNSDGKIDIVDVSIMLYYWTD